jgi:hypothetical protein
MKAKAFPMWVLGAALLAGALYVLRPGMPRDTPAESAARVSGTPPAAPTTGAARDDAAAADRASAESREAAQAVAPRPADPVPDTPPPVLLPNQVVATPMVEAIRGFGGEPPPGLLEAERSFAAEPVDPQWATAEEAHILGKLAERTGFEVSRLEAECRTTLCRLQLVEHTPFNKDGLKDLLDSLAMNTRWVITVPNSRWMFNSVIYLERGSNDTGPDGRESADPEAPPQPAR